MPGTDRRTSAIPRASPPKRPIPIPPPVKANAPIPLRGTRPTAPPSDTYTHAPPRTRLPSGPRFHVPVMHSPALPDIASRASSSTTYTQSRGTAGDNGSKKGKEIETEEEKDSDGGSQTASEPDDSALSPGFGLIEALAFERDSNTREMEGGGKLFTENSRSFRAFERSASEETDMSMERENMSSPRAGNSMSSFPVNSPPLDDTTITPRPAPWQNMATAGPSTAPFPVATEKRAEMRQRSIHAETLRTTGARRPTTSSTHQSNIRISPTPAPSQSPSGPYAMLRELEMLLGPAIVSQFIDLPTILGAHDACPVPSSTSPAGRAATVFGVPLCISARYASCNTVLGGQTHMLPIVVFAAIEELYRVGLKTPRLLRPGPSSGTTLPSLVAAFDTGPSYGDGVDLSITPTARSSGPLDDISALLLTYLDCLPGPILVSPLLPSLLQFCVRSHMSSNIKAARLLLRLLPAPHFSLLIYLLAFLAQLPVYGDLNAWTMKGVAGEFSRVVCGTCEEGEGEEVLEWLLRHWDVLSAGLFPSAAPVSTDAEEDLSGRIAALERQHAAALRTAYEAGATAERTMWVEEVQALRDAGEAQERIVRRIVRRFAEGAPGVGGVL